MAKLCRDAPNPQRTHGQSPPPDPARTAFGRPPPAGRLSNSAVFFFLTPPPALRALTRVEAAVAFER